MPATDTLVRVAKITGAEEKPLPNGEILFVLKADDLEFATKKQEIAAPGQALLGQVAKLTYREQTVTKETQHGERTYTNRYLDKVEPAEGAQLTINQPGQNASQNTPRASSDDRELSIMRQCGTKVAVAMFPFLTDAERTPEGLLTISDWLLAYYQHGSGGSSPAAAAVDDPGPSDRPPLADSDAPYDDGIPF